MEKTSPFWLILVILILWFLGIIFLGKSDREYFSAYQNYAYTYPPNRYNWTSPFSGDYGYIAEHNFLNNWYNSPYFNNVPSWCVVPGQTNLGCVNQELVQGRAYPTAVTRCTSPPSVDSRCY